MTITSKQRKILEKIAQPLSPVVLVGGAGVSEALISQVANAFETREILKVKFNEYKDEKRELSEKIAEGVGATLVRIIGNVAIFYKPSDKDSVEHIKI